MNKNFSDDNTEINNDDFAVTSQDHFSTFDYLDVLLRDNDDTEELIIRTDFIPTKYSGDIAAEVKEKFRYGFKFSGGNF